MIVTALIPARYGATRFPGKLMQPLGGVSVIRRTFEAARSSGLFQQVVVATDSDEIEEEIKQTAKVSTAELEIKAAALFEKFVRSLTK